MTPPFSTEGFELLDNLIKWCKASGVYMIIDLHASPGGQTGQNIDDSANDQALLFIDPKYQDRLVQLWAKIATRYQDEPTVAAYDLLNEPLPERTGAAGKYRNQLEPLYKRPTQAIRAVDKQHMVTVEGYDWANNWSVFTSRFDNNLVYQFHYYCWNNPTELKSIDRYLAERKRLEAPVWVGETGKDVRFIGPLRNTWKRTTSAGLSGPGKNDAANGPYSIKTPDGWDAIVAVSQRRGGQARTRSGPTGLRSITAEHPLGELRLPFRCRECPVPARSGKS